MEGRWHSSETPGQRRAINILAVQSAGLASVSTESVCDLCGRMVLSVGGGVLPDKESIDTEARGHWL